MALNKTLLCSALGVAMGVSAENATAATLNVTSWTLMDFDSDGLMSDMEFTLAPPGNSGNKFGASGETGCFNATDGDTCDDITFGAGNGQPDVATFTTGFNFGGGGVYSPIVTGSMQASIDSELAALGDGQALQFSVLEWGGIYQTTSFILPPDHLQNCTGELPGATGEACGETSMHDTNPLLSNPLGYNVEITDLSSGDYGVVLRFLSTTTGDTVFAGNPQAFRLEGVMHTSAVPVPAAVWLFGSGLIGLVGIARKKSA